MKIEEFGPGDVAFIPQGFGHYVEQIGDDPTEIVILFNSPFYQEISISDWLASNPASIIEANFGLSRELVDKLPKGALGILA